MKATGNTILITGGGSGIGAALARRLHDLGNTVIVAGRRREALNQVAVGRANIYALTLDIGDAGSITAFAKQLLADHLRLNLLINNAGIMRSEPLETARNLADAEATIATNLLGPIRLTDALIDHLVAQPDATIVNVSSGLAFVPSVAAPVYAATKAAIHSYTISLRLALRGKVEVIELAPPGVQTALTPGQETRAGYMPLDAFIDEAMQLLGQQPTLSEILVEKVRPLRSADGEGRVEQMAAAIYAAARGGRQD